MDALNFLPWRAQARQRRLRFWQLGLALAVLSGLALNVMVYTGLQQALQREQTRAEQERQQLQQARQAMQQLHTEEAALHQLQQQWQWRQALQPLREWPPLLMQWLATGMPEGVQLRQLEWQEAGWSLQGETARADALPALGDAVAEAGLDGRLLQQEHGVTSGAGGQGAWLLRWEWGQRMLPDLRPLPTMPAGASSSASAATEDMP